MSGSADLPENHLPVRRFRMTSLRRVGDKVIGTLIRLGVVPGSYLLTTRGRKTGKPRTNPVTLVESEGRRWLVAPYGVVSWVLNARAAGTLTLRRGRDTSEFAIREVSAEEAGPVLKRYIAITGPPQRYFHATRKSPVEEFVAEAQLHPVFELLPTNPTNPTEPS